MATSSGGSVDNSAASAGDLVEGTNILDIVAELDDEAVMPKVYATGQDQGSDDRFGRKVAEVAAQATNGLARSWLQQRVLMESPGQQKDAQTRADFEMADQLYTSVNVQIIVKG